VSWAALSRAIELNGVAVDRNLLALAIGRLAAADPKALEPDTDDAARREAELPIEAVFTEARQALTAYQNRAWAERFEHRLRRVLTAEQRCSGADGRLPLTRQVARSLRKLMALKDEYEVARLYTDGSFERQLSEQFEGVTGLRFHMAPPLLAHSRNGKVPRKRTYGPWMMPLLRVLAQAKVLRGTPLDIFGYTAERRGERALIGEYEATVSSLLDTLDAGNVDLAADIASIPEHIRGYGHVKEAHLHKAKAREAELLREWRNPLRVVQAA
jgi:indolepyruvate ferredoxin oxidoreductase